MVTWDGARGTATVRTQGDGAAWLRDRAPRLLGLEDDVTGFDPATAPLRDLWRRHRHARLARTGTLWHDLAGYAVQQRITSVDAALQWRRLVLRHGTPAPGDPTLRTPPSPATVAALGYHELHDLGIERQRADVLRRAARAAPRLAPLVDADLSEALPALRSIPGVGPWTSSNVGVRTWGDRDQVVVGDLGLPSHVAWVLAGEHRADDGRLLELVEPYRPHRARVVALALAAAGPPRRHPRARRIDIRAR